ncbi:NAD-dependent epimerase/dehydratase family protein [Mycolicibacterium sp. HK-90]|uniref:NAD-dependent epimerase/dehydratase family protein n=1 Tax=Mycolicibacterium sp. HK-90 TaxID=3056937 RepID=UPI002657BC3A|nr:NAD-dependent epimerase/dehydratase family protein [Mycolicibacterium sp. HK-90]WKG02924.1 NAD-dependent epimerase/dehydratase family protein [Mycolicibacterium sp. HK-90]
MAGRILVTGGAGYLGSALVAELVCNGEAVTVMTGPDDRAAQPGGLGGGVEVVRADVTDAGSIDSAMRGISHVYHLAGIASPNSRLAHSIWNVNVLGAYHVAQSALRHGVHRVVHVSSTAAIGYPPDGVVADELFDVGDSVLDNVYAATKRAGERVMLDFGERGLDVVVVNPAAVFAPASGPPRSWQGLLAAARRGVLRGVPPGGTAVCSARDFVVGATAAMAKGGSGERYILSSANLTYRRIAELLVEAVGRSHRVHTLPMGLFRAAGAGNRAVRDLIGNPRHDDALVPENVELMARHVYYTSGKAERELGMSRMSAAELITEFVR